MTSLISWEGLAQEGKYSFPSQLSTVLISHSLIAIMLGRLRMSVEECITAYVKLMKRIFERKENRSIMSALGRVKPRFSSRALSDAIAEVLQSSGHSISEKFEEDEEPTCKV